MHPVPHASFPPNAPSQGSGTIFHTHSSANKNAKADEQINKEASQMERFQAYQQPVQDEDKWYAAEESPSTGTQFCIAESNSTEEATEELQDDIEEVWSLQQQQDELMEMMKQVSEERDACREELEVLRDHCTALEDERSQLLSRVGTIILLHCQLRFTYNGTKMTNKIFDILT